METVLITGASSGIGKDLAELFARKKYNLILVARSKDVLQKITTEYEQNFGVQVQVILTLIYRFPTVLYSCITK